MSKVVVFDQCGCKFIYKDGKLHCEDGPAIVHVDGAQWWYLEGVQLTEEEFKQRLELMRLAQFNKMIEKALK